MHQYLIDTEFAVKNLLKLAIEEEKILEEQKTHLASAEAQFRVHRWDFESSDLNDDFSDAYVMAAFGRMAKASQEAERLKQEIADLQKQMKLLYSRIESADLSEGIAAFDPMTNRPPHY